jgi:subtilisin-like proprotein convertase family protein
MLPMRQKPCSINQRIARWFRNQPTVERHSRRLGVARLEDRITPDVAGGLGVPATIDAQRLAELIRPSASAPAMLNIPPMDDQAMPARLAQRGDWYWADGQRIDLLRRENELAVRFLDGDVNSSLDAIMNGPLAGFTAGRQIAKDAVILRSATRSADSVSVQDINWSDYGVAWAAPVFHYAESDSWMVATNEVIIQMPDPMRPMIFSFDPKIVSARPLWGTPDQFVVTLAGGAGTNALEISQKLSKEPGLGWACPNSYQKQEHFYIPNDTRFPIQWHLRNTGQTGGTPGADIRANLAWDVTQGGSNSISISVIDSGFDLTHPDLAYRFNSLEFFGQTGVDDDGNGWMDDFIGWDFYQNDNIPGWETTEGDYHGTPVAGIAAARGDNGFGVAGVAYKSLVLPVRISGPFGFTTYDNQASAVYYASGRTKNGLSQWASIHVLNCSWGGGAPNTALSTAFSWASSSARSGKGTATFIAAGNSALDGKIPVAYPANLAGQLSGVVAVGASNDLDVRSGYSQYGPELDFVASSSRFNPASAGPGGTVSTDIQGSPGFSPTDYTSVFGGTSSASPAAAGTAALAFALDSNLTAAQVRGLLRNTTDYIAGDIYNPATGFNNEYGYGRLNANTAVRGVNTRKAQVLINSFIVPNSTGSVPFPDTAVGGQSDYIFRLRNQGTLNLTLGTINVTGPFSVVNQFGSTNLGAGGITNFVVRFSPTAGGMANGTVSFTTNDPSAPTYSFAVTGLALGGSTGAISGTSYDDLNSNGVRDAGEPGIAGRTIYIDANNNGTFDAGETSVMTSSTGLYTLGNLPPGTYAVRQVVPNGVTITAPANGVHNVTVTAGMTSSGRDFGNSTTTFGSISGVVFQDLNGNGIRDAGEPGIANQKIYLDDNNSSAHDTLYTWFWTDPYPLSLPIPDLGFATVSFNVSGLTGPITDVDTMITLSHSYLSDLSAFLIRPATSQSVQLFSGIGGSSKLGLYETWFDDDAPISINSGSPPYTGSFRPSGTLATFNGGDPNGEWRLRINDNVAFDTGKLNEWGLAIGTMEPFVLTDANGKYSFTGLKAGEYRVRQVVPSGTTLSAPVGGVHLVTLSGGQVIGDKDFGNVIPGPITFVVDALGDVDDGNYGPGQQTLREAINRANNNSGHHDTITFSPALFSSAQTITLTNGQLKITDPLTITGPGSNLLTLKGNGTDRHILIDNANNPPVTISGLTFDGGKQTGNLVSNVGGSILVNNAALTLTNCVFSNNSAEVWGGAVGVRGTGSVNATNVAFSKNTVTSILANYGGAALYADGTATVNLNGCLFDGNTATGQGGKTGFGGAVAVFGSANAVTITNSTFTNNSSLGGGGAIFLGQGASGSNILIVDSTLANNSTSVSGGAILLDGAANLTVRNSTLSGNTANTNGGGIRAYTSFTGTLTVENSTIAFNKATNGAGGGLSRGAGLFNIASTIVAKNTAATTGDISGTVTANNSLIGSATGASISGSNNKIGVDPLLSPLANNGGSTLTHALLPGSPAIDAGSNPANLMFDQRGNGFARTIGKATDIGAFETQTLTAPPTVTGIVINANQTQRSMVTSIKVSFSEAVTIGSGAFVLARTGYGSLGTVNLNISQVGSDVTITFTTGGSVGVDPGGSLQDGQYKFTIVADQISGSGGKLDGNNNMISEGSPIDDKSATFHRLFGDADGNGSVTAADFAAFRLAYGTNGPSNFDFDNNGSVSAADFNAFRLRYGVTILP